MVFSQHDIVEGGTKYMQFVIVDGNASGVDDETSVKYIVERSSEALYLVHYRILRITCDGREWNSEDSKAAIREFCNVLRVDDDYVFPNNEALALLPHNITFHVLGRNSRDPQVFEKRGYRPEDDPTDEETVISPDRVILNVRHRHAFWGDFTTLDVQRTENLRTVHEAVDDLSEVAPVDNSQRTTILPIVNASNSSVATSIIRRPRERKRRMNFLDSDEDEEVVCLDGDGDDEHSSQITTTSQFSLKNTLSERLRYCAPKYSDHWQDFRDIIVSTTIRQDQGRVIASRRRIDAPGAGFKAERLVAVSHDNNVYLVVGWDAYVAMEIIARERGMEVENGNQSVHMTLASFNHRFALTLKEKCEYLLFIEDRHNMFQSRRSELDMMSVCRSVMQSLSGPDFGRLWRQPVTHLTSLFMNTTGKDEQVQRFTGLIVQSVLPNEVYEIIFEFVKAIETDHRLLHFKSYAFYNTGLPIMIRHALVEERLNEADVVEIFRRLLDSRKISKKAVEELKPCLRSEIKDTSRFRKSRKVDETPDRKRETLSLTNSDNHAIETDSCMSGDPDNVADFGIMLTQQFRSNSGQPQEQNSLSNPCADRQLMSQSTSSNSHDAGGRLDSRRRKRKLSPNASHTTLQHPDDVNHEGDSETVHSMSQSDNSPVRADATLRLASGRPESSGVRPENPANVDDNAPVGCSSPLVGSENTRQSDSNASQSTAVSSSRSSSRVIDYITVLCRQNIGAAREMCRSGDVNGVVWYRPPYVEVVKFIGEMQSTKAVGLAAVVEKNSEIVIVVLLNLELPSSAPSGCLPTFESRAQLFEQLMKKNRLDIREWRNGKAVRIEKHSSKVSS